MAITGAPEHGGFQRCHKCGGELDSGTWQCPACSTPVPTSKLGKTAKAWSLGRILIWTKIGALLIIVLNLYSPYVVPYLRPIWPIKFAPLVGESMNRLKKNKDALTLLGTSIRHGWLVEGYLEHIDSELSGAGFRFSVQGARGDGTVEARLGRIENTWVFSDLKLLPRNGVPVNLLQASDDPPREKISLKRRIYLVPVGNLGEVGMSELPEFYKNNFGLDVAVLPPISLETWVRNDARRQLIAEEIVTLMQRRLPNVAKDPDAILIGITDDDIYFRERNWNFTYTYWDGDRGGAVSTARFHSPHDNANSILKSRTRKMISRVIGMLVLKLPRSEDPSSVLARELYGSFSADLMSDYFDGLGSLAVVDNFVSAHWLPSLPATIIDSKKNFDEKTVDGSYPCLLIQRNRDSGSQAPLFKSSITKCLPQLLINREVDEVEIDFRTGRLMTKETDLFIGSTTPLAATRCYQPWDRIVRTFGYNTSFAWDMYPSGSRDPYSAVGINLCGGHRIEFERISEGSSYLNALFEHRQTATPFLRARFGWAGSGWDLDLTDGTHMFFPESYNGKRSVDGAAVKFKTAKGESISIERDHSRNLIGLIRTQSEFLKFDYDSRNRMVRARDHRNRLVTYNYDLAGRLVQVNAAKSSRRYSYEGTNLLSVHENGEPLFQIRYTRGRIAEISIYRTDTYKFRYDYEPRDNYTVSRTYVTAPNGTVTKFDIVSK
jgi:YD repeat-containing protein